MPFRLRTGVYFFRFRRFKAARQQFTYPFFLRQ